jgi:hypothetical protein
VQAVDALLLPLGVKYLVLPSLKGATLNMWTKHFGFRQLSPVEHEVGLYKHTLEVHME